MAFAILVGRTAEENEQTRWFSESWREALLKLDPHLDIRIWPDIGNIDDIDFVLVWNHPLGVLKKFRRAKVIYSLAAGVDHIFVDPDLNTDIPIVRIIDTYMANDIVQYVTAYILNYIKRVNHWRAKQQEKKWSKEPPFTLAEQSIGIMGLGHLGGKAAYVLNQLGLRVNGWSQTPKELTGVTHYTGQQEWLDFLTHTHVLVCMLPLTAKTKNILNRTTFSYLPKGAYLINVGRGQHLVEEDLLEAIQSGQLTGACLDVFREEPLPASHPFWSHPNIIVTPHIASVTNPDTAAPQLYDNYLRALSGKVLHHQVDVYKGY